MKKIAVFFKNPNKLDYPFSIEKYLISYKDLAKTIESMGAEFYIVRDIKTYIGDNTFTKSWKFQGKEIIETGNIKIDTLYDKGRFTLLNKKSDIKSILNTKEINDLCTDKQKTYDMFPNISPKTITVNNLQELRNALTNIKTTTKVVKENFKGSGTGVYIDTKSNLLKIEHNFPVIVQEFLDTSGGIPGIYKGIHDFRLILFNNQIISTHFRTPPEGGLIANIGRGGTLTYIENKNIPKSALKLVQIIQKKLKKPNLYSIDLGFVNGTPKLIELNSQVGLPFKKDKNHYKLFLNKLATMLINM